MQLAPRNVTIRATQAQREFLTRAVQDDWQSETLGYGGSRFGGKSFSGCSAMVIRALMYPGTMHLALRRILSASDMNLGKQIKLILKSHGMTLGTQASGQVAYLTKDYQFVFPNGSIIQLGYCKNDADYEQHVGPQWDTVWLEQAEQFPELVFDQLKGSNRKSCMTECVPRFLLTFNPGGRGSEWLFRRVIDPVTRDRRTVYVKSLIRECPATLEQDPAYILRSLNKIKDPILRAQWLEGDWDAKSGSYFRLMPSSLRVIGQVPNWADWFGGVDWGRSNHFAYIMAAHWQDRGDKFGNLGKRHIHIAKEVYAKHLDLDIQAKRALEAELLLRKSYPMMHEIDVRLADPTVFNVIESESKDTSRSKADVWAKHGFFVYPSPAYQRVSRWELIRYLLRHDILTIDPEGCPGLVTEFKTATYKPESEDLNQKTGYDDALDACLVKGTLVTTQRGDIPIESVLVGDMALTRKGYRRVTDAAMTSPCSATYEIEFSNGKKLRGTGNHPVFTTNRGWSRLDSLGSTNTVSKSAAPVRVVRVTDKPNAPVYNLSVDGEPEYFANGILVHNCAYLCSYLFGLDYTEELPQMDYSLRDFLRVA